MVNYNNGKIYKIEPICTHDECDKYIGSTTKEYLSQRMDKHRNNYKQWKQGKRSKTRSFELFDKYGVENCKIILIELVNASCKDELHSREAHYIKMLNCVNKVVPLRSEREYRADNKDKIKEHKKQYYQDNKEKIQQHYIDNKEKIRQYNNEKIPRLYQCSCGSILTYDHKARHFNTKKHCKFIENIIL